MDGFIPFSTGDLDTPQGIGRLNTMLESLFLNGVGDGVAISDFTGYGSPETVISASVGSTYRRIDGSSGTTFYVKQTGSGNTGWVALAGPVSYPLSVANGGTGADFSSQAIGSIFVFNGTGTIAALTPGASGYILASQGTGATPAYVPPTPQKITLVSVTAFSGASTTGSIAITSGQFYVAKVFISSMVSPDILWLRFNGDTTASSYGYIFRGFNYAAAASNGNSDFGATKIILTSQNFSGGEHIDVNLYPNALTTTCYGHITGDTVNTKQVVDFQGAWNAGTPTSFSIVTSGGGNMAGTVYLYQLALS